MVRTTVLQADGKLLLAEGSQDGQIGSVARLLRDGRLDRTFGDGGVASVPDAAWGTIELTVGGSILVGGTIGEEAAIAKLTSDGRLDQGFGAGGILRSDFRGLVPGPETGYYDDYTKTKPSRFRPQNVADLAVAADGSLLALTQVEVCRERDSKPRCRQDYSVSQRLEPDGSTVNGFGGDTGSVASAEPIGADSILPLPDGAYVVIGRAVYSDDETSDGMVLGARFTADGRRDLTYGRRGDLELDGLSYTGSATGETIDPNGRLLAAGFTGLARFDRAGKPDKEFGRGGRLDFYAVPDPDHIQQIMVDDRGTFLAAGASTSKDKRYLFVARGAAADIANEGFASSDPSFSNDGYVRFRVGAHRRKDPVPTRARIVTDARGAILLAGSARVGGAARTTVLRVTGDREPVKTCGGKRVAYQGTPGVDRVSEYGVIHSGGGDDVIDASSGPVCAGPGDDRVIVNGDSSFDEGDNVVRLGSGNDVAVTRRGRYSEDLGETFLGGPGRDRLVGDHGEDTLLGGPGADRISGGGERDEIRGGAGRDRLLGQDGNDVVIGGLGRDIARGGPTAPVFTEYSARHGRTKVHARRIGSRITELEFEAKSKCHYTGGGNGSADWVETAYGGASKPLKIGSGGRFGFLDEYYGSWTDVSEFRGRLAGDRIRGHFRIFDEVLGTDCSTRSFVKFVTGKGKPRIQVVRP